MSEQIETKHQAYNLKLQDHPVFIDQYTITDADGDVFMWINKHTGAASFSFKYFHIFKEQKLIEALNQFVRIGQNLTKTPKISVTDLKEATTNAEKVLAFYQEDGES